MLSPGSNKLLIALTIISFLFLHTTDSHADSQKPFKVGVIVPLTGNAADYGIAIKNSIELALHDKPDLFTNIQFLYEDAAYDPKMAISAFNKSVESDKVNLTVTWGVSFCKALAPIAESRKIPLVGICLDPTIATNKRYVLRFKNTTDEIMEAQAKYLATQGAKKIALVLAEHPYLEEVTEALKRNLQPEQSLTIVDQVPNGDMDLRTIILKLEKRKSEFDAVGVFLFAGQIANFYKQARDLKFSIPTFGTDFFESLSEVKASDSAMNGAIFTSIEIKKPFLEKYRQTFHNESQLAFGAPAYELAMTVGGLFNQKAASPSSEEIISNFSSIKPQEGVAAGPYHYINSVKAGQYFQFPVVVKRIQGDSFEIIR